MKFLKNLRKNAGYAIATLSLLVAIISIIFVGSQKVKADLGDVAGIGITSTGISLIRVTSTTMMPGVTLGMGLGDGTHVYNGTWTNKIVLSRQTVTANTTIAAGSSQYIGVTALAANITLTLPAPSLVNNGNWIVQDETGSADATHQIILASAAGSVLGTTNVTTAYGRRTTYTNGTNYFSQ